MQREHTIKEWPEKINMDRYSAKENRLSQLVLLVTGLFLWGVINNAGYANPSQPTYKLSLKTAINLAMKESKSIKLKEIDFRSADLAYKEERTNLYPKVELEASSSYLTNPKKGVTIHKGEFGFAPSVNSEFPIPFPDRDYVLVEDQKHTYFKITAKLTQPLFTWNKIKNAIEIARIQRDLKFEELRKEKREIKKQVKTLYYSVLLSSMSYKQLQKIEKIEEEIVKDKTNLYSEGLINLQELLEAKSQLAQIERKVIEAKESYLTAMTSLKILTGLTRLNDSNIQLTDKFPDKLLRIEEEKLLKHAIKTSPDIKSLRKKLEESNRYLSIQRASTPLIPDFSLILTLDITGQKIPIIGGNWTDYWDKNFIVTLGTKLKLFDAGESKYRAEKAEEGIKAAITGIESYKELLKIKIRKTIEELKTNYYTMKEKEAELKAAREAKKNAEVSYKSELITREKLGKAKIFLISKELEYLLALFNYADSINKVEYLTGESLNKNQ